MELFLKKKTCTVIGVELMSGEQDENSGGYDDKCLNRNMTP